MINNNLDKQNINANNGISSYLERPEVKQKFIDVLGDKAPAFCTSLISLAKSTALKDCSQVSIVKAAMAAATLDLPINNNLGFAYILPYKTKHNNQDITEAQFQIGYKGFIQLAIRSDRIVKLNASVLTKSQFKSFDPIQGTLNYDITDLSDSTPYVYVTYMKFRNGFEKYEVKTIEQIKEHAIKYSKSYKKDMRNNTSYSVWKTNFDEMAKKTVLKLLLTKYAPLSIDIQTAIEKDQAVITDNGLKYVDNETDTISIEKNQEQAKVANSTENIKDLLIGDNNENSNR